MNESEQRYSFRGPGVAISCVVEYDRERECYVATGSPYMDDSSGVFIGTADSRHAAALACFEAWMTSRHAYWKPPQEDQT